MSSPLLPIIFAIASSSLLCVAAPLSDSIANIGHGTTLLFSRVDDSNPPIPVHTLIQPKPLQTHDAPKLPNDRLHVAVALVLTFVLVVLGVGLAWYYKCRPLRDIRQPHTLSSPAGPLAHTHCQSRDPLVHFKVEMYGVGWGEGGGTEEKEESQKGKAPALTLNAKLPLSPIIILEKRV